MSTFAIELILAVFSWVSVNVLTLAHTEISCVWFAPNFVIVYVSVFSTLCTSSAVSTKIWSISKFSTFILTFTFFKSLSVIFFTLTIYLYWYPGLSICSFSADETFTSTCPSWILVVIVFDSFLASPYCTSTLLDIFFKLILFTLKL